MSNYNLILAPNWSGCVILNTCFNMGDDSWGPHGMSYMYAKYEQIETNEWKFTMTAYSDKLCVNQVPLNLNVIQSKECEEDGCCETSFQLQEPSTDISAQFNIVNNCPVEVENIGQIQTNYSIILILILILSILRQ